MEQKDYVSYDVAKALKGKGFDYKKYLLKNGNWMYNDIGEIRWGITYKKMIHLIENTKWAVYAPTLYDTIKWLRETYNIKVMPQFFMDKNNYGYDLYLGTEWDCTHSHIGSYEEALNEGIKQALKYI